MSKEKKLKIKTNKKSYLKQDSPFYKITSKKKLAEILFSSIPVIKRLSDNNNYNVFIENIAGKRRGIQTPNDNLYKIHNRIASLLCRIKTSDALHSGTKGRSNITNAKAHLGTNLSMLTVDLKNFYGSTKKSHVFDLFYNTFKCTSDVADLISNLVTYQEYLPTGSQSSMVLAYLANIKMFNEIQSYAESVNCKMTIYVDDLTFSGKDIDRKFLSKVEMICNRYGHKINPRKIRFYSSCQYKLVTGVAIKEEQAFPKNKHLKELSADIMVWKSNKSDRRIESRILGKLVYLGSIDPKFMNYAKSLRS